MKQSVGIFLYIDNISYNEQDSCVRQFAVETVNTAS